MLAMSELRRQHVLMSEKQEGLVGTTVAEYLIHRSREDTMPTSTLDFDAMPTSGDGVSVGKGHGTGALGPSDSSDTGSDIVGGPGLLDDETIDLDRGTNEDSEGGRLSGTDAGADLGDVDLDSDTDASGTGERITAGKDPHAGVSDERGFDRVVSADEAGLGAGLDQAEEAQLEITDEELGVISEDDANDARSADRAARKSSK